MLLEKGYAKKLGGGGRWGAHCANIGSDTTFRAKARDSLAFRNGS